MGKLIAVATLLQVFGGWNYASLGVNDAGC